eukprot:TRINITY_DN5517_c0_g1_i1.p1 TRINITY_DN5517_c0_g1~~TRINITY_DN5517_c0_g1_i1.p1  ORF type:complete len:297 (+),score=39.25 TRINITY_DN5517_c0_g1_i1:66-956(+)
MSAPRTYCLLKNGKHLHYVVHGSGPQRLLFIMGLMTAHVAWEEQVNYFAKRREFQICVFDNLGTGLSSPVESRTTTRAMAGHALELLDHLCWGEGHVVGISMGGMIAQELALLAPRRVASLTLLCTHAGGLGARPPLYGALLLLMSLVAPRRHAATLALRSAFSDPFLNKNVDDPRNPGAQTKRQRVLIRKFAARHSGIPLAPLRTFVWQLLAVLTHYVSTSRLQRLRGTGVRTVVVTGTADRLVRPSNSTTLAAALGADLVELADVGHSLNDEASQAVNLLVERNVLNSLHHAAL